MDQAILQLTIQAQNDRVLAGLASFERSLAGLEKAHIATGQAADRHTLQLNNFGNQLSNLVTRGAGLFVAFEAIKNAFGAFDGLEQHNIDLLRTTEILGGNARAASTWSVVAHEMGISLDQIDRGFTKLSTDLNSTGNPALKQMGIAAEDSHGKLRPLNDVINQAADYFHAHAGAVNNAALANQLFGRSGYELLPILEQGRAGLAAITAEAAKYGLILDSQTIQRNAMFTFQLKEAQLAVSGLGMAVGNALLPGIAALGQAFSKVIEDNLPAFIAMIGRAVGYVIGLVEGFTGLTLQVGKGATELASLTAATGNTGSAMDKAASSGQALADAIQKIRDRTQDATRAIDAQVQALNAQQQAQSFLDQQAKLKQQSEDEQLNIVKLSQDKQLALFLGNAVQARQLDEQLTTAKEQNAQTQLSITRGAESEATKLKVAELEKQKQSIQDAANAQIAAMQAAARGTTDAMAGAAAAMPPLFGKGSKDAANLIDKYLTQGVTDTGKQMGGKLADAIFGPEVWVDDPSHGIQGLKGHLERKGGGDFLKIGTAIGDAIGVGITTAMGKAVSKWFSDQANYFSRQPIDRFLNPPPPPPAKYDRGGTVPGPVGAPQLAVVHGGEQVSTPGQQGETNALLRHIARLLEAINDPAPRGTLFAYQQSAR